MDLMDSQKCKLGRKGFDKLLCPSYYTYRMFKSETLGETIE